MYVHRVGKYEVIFDSKEDYDAVTCVQWSKWKKRRSIWVDNTTSKPYAMISYRSKNIRIHHILAGYPLEKRMVDHFNGNSLDNRRSNLRVVTRSENGFNKACKNKQTRWIKKQKNGNFTVTMRLGLGTYPTIEEANCAISKFFKENKISIYEEFL